MCEIEIENTETSNSDYLDNMERGLKVIIDNSNVPPQVAYRPGTSELLMRMLKRLGQVASLLLDATKKEREHFENYIKEKKIT